LDRTDINRLLGAFQIAAILKDRFIVAVHLKTVRTNSDATAAPDALIFIYFYFHNYFKKVKQREIKGRVSEEIKGQTFQNDIIATAYYLVTN